MVVEKTDYLTGRNVRYLRVDTPDLPSSQLGAGGRAETPPPRDSTDDHTGDGGGSGGRDKLGQSKLRGWAPPQNISPDKLFGDTAAALPSAGMAGGNGNREVGGVGGNGSSNSRW